MLLTSGAAACSGGPLGTVEVERCVDEPDMAERLRKVAQHSARVRVVFLREQPDIVAERQEALEKSVGFIMAFLQRIIVGQPEAAPPLRPGATRRRPSRCRIA
jgi:hypothetical protein